MKLSLREQWRLLNNIEYELAHYHDNKGSMPQIPYQKLLAARRQLTKEHTFRTPDALV